MNNLTRRFRLVLATVLVMVLSAALVGPTGNALPREVREKTVPATVKIYALDNDLVPVSTGSGSILVQTGQVLTNYHVVADPETGELAHDDGVVLISITTDPRDPPNPTYLGKVIRSDVERDLALVTVASDISGRDLEDCLSLPTYAVGDSDDLIIGDEIAVIGFPGLGGNSVTYTEGTISGFEEAAPWIKTDTEINPGNSGGSAIDADGNLIGVPTEIMTSGDSSMQGKIGYVRPIAAAREITDGVGQMGVPGCQGGSSLGSVPSTSDYGPAFVGFLGYTTSADAAEPVETAPSGSVELYAHLEYYAVPTDTPLSYEWLLNGRPTRAGEESDAWPFEAGDGQFTITTTNASGLPDGDYSVRVTAGERVITTPEITVGGAGTTTDRVSVRGRVLSADTDRPLAGAYFAVLAPGITWSDVDLENPDHVLDVSSTNAEGAFQTNVDFPTDERYSVGVAAEGYEDALYDDVDLTELDSAGGGFVDAGSIRLKAN